MYEKKEEQKIQEQTSGQQAEETTQTQSASMVDRAIQAAERLERANKTMEENISRQEALYAKQQLGGQAEAAVQKPKEPELSDEDFSKKATSNDLFQKIE